MKYEIIKGMDMPSRCSSANDELYKVLKSMEIGDAIDVTGASYTRIGGHCAYMKKRAGGMFLPKKNW